MKTLDEVINWYENRKGVLIGKATMEEMENSILHYLKGYRNYRKKIAHLSDACDECLYQWDCHIDPCCPFAKLDREEERE